MIDEPRGDSRPRRFLWAALFALLLLHGTLAALFIASRIFAGDLASHEASIESLLQRTGPFEWRVEGLSLAWRGLNPVIEIRTLSAMPGQTQPETAALLATLAETGRESALQVQQLHAYVDIARSLWSRELRLFGLRADSVEVAVQAKDGRFALAGSRASGGNFDAPGFFAALRYVDLQSLRVLALEGNAANPSLQEMPLLAVQMQRGDEASLLLQSSPLQESDAALDGLRLRAAADGAWNAAGTALRAHFEIGGDRGSAWARLLGHGAGLGALDMQGWLHKRAFAPLRANAVVASLQLDIPDRVEGMLPVEGMVLPTLENARGELALNRREDLGWQLLWRDFAADIDGRRVDLPDGRFSVRRDWLQRRQLALVVDSMDIETARRELAALQMAPKQLADVLDQLQPRGTLRDIELDFGPGATGERQRRELMLRSKLDGVSVKAWKGAPAVTDLHGEITLSQSEGALRFEPGRALTLGFPKLYRKPLAFRSARGEMRWSLQDSRLLLESDALQLEPLRHGADIAAQLALNARLRADDEAPSQMRLRIGYTDAELQHLVQYIPYTLPAGVGNWIEASAASGSSPQGGFIYNGSLQRGDSLNRDIRVFLELDGAEASFANGWPRAESLRGLVSISPQRSTVALHSASIASVPVTDADIAIDSGAKGAVLSADAKLAGSLGPALDLLKSAPVGADLRPVIDDWRAGGKLEQGSLQFVLPLQGEALAPTLLIFASRLEGASLYMPRLNLSLENLRGDLRYDLDRGLQSKRIDASLFGQPWRLRMGAEPESGEGVAANRAQSLVLAAEGVASASALQRWLKLPVLGFAGGSARFDLQLEQQPGRAGLRVSSDLVGLSLDAPLPFYKQGMRIQPLALNWDLSSRGQPMLLSLPGLFDAEFAFDEFDYQGGQLVVGGTALKQSDTERAAAAAPLQAFDEEAEALPERRLLLRGALPRFELAAWQNAFLRYQKFSGDARTAKEQEAAAVTLIGRGIRIGEASLFGQQIANAIVDFDTRDSDVLLRIASEQLAGAVSLPYQLADSGDAPTQAVQAAPAGAPLSNMPSLPGLDALDGRVRVALQHLKLPGLGTSAERDDTAGSASEPLAPENLLPLDVAVDALSIGGKPLGAWKFLLSASDSAALVHRISGDLHGLRINSEADDGMLWAYDASGALNTALSATMATGNLTGFIEKALVDPARVPLRAGDFSMGLALGWPGSPLDIDLQSLNGDLELAVGEGKFYRVSESATGFLKLLGLLNFDTLLRRMQLDFKDVYKEGLSFDSISAEFQFEQQQLHFIRSPIAVRSPSSKFSLAGSVDLAASTIDAELVATMPVANNLPWIAALAGGLPVAAGTFIVTRVLGDQFDQLSSAVYSVRGELDEPELKFERLFDNKTSKSGDAPG